MTDELLDAMFAREEAAQPGQVPMPEDAWGAAEAKWTPYKGRHQPCADCVALIHERGTAAASYPAPARFRRKGPNDEILVCVVHAEERRRYDAGAKRLAKARAEIASHEQRAARASRRSNRT
jgi:hypothetical protein